MIQVCTYWESLLNRIEAGAQVSPGFFDRLIANLVEFCGYVPS